MHKNFLLKLMLKIASMFILPFLFLHQPMATLGQVKGEKEKPECSCHTAKFGIIGDEKMYIFANQMRSTDAQEKYIFIPEMGHSVEIEFHLHCDAGKFLINLESLKKSNVQLSSYRKFEVISNGKIISPQKREIPFKKPDFKSIGIENRQPQSIYELILPMEKTTVGFEAKFLLNLSNEMNPSQIYGDNTVIFVDFEP